MGRWLRLIVTAGGRGLMNQIIPYEAFIARRVRQESLDRADAVDTLLQDLSNALNILLHQVRVTQKNIQLVQQKLALREGRMRKLDEAYREAISASSLEEMERARDRYKLLHDQFYRER